jgi:hypothetical protein
MYQDTPAVDVSGALSQIRREDKARTDENWKGSKDLLRGAAVASIRKDYKDGISWDEGVKSADESFKRQYERMMVADPAAAQQLRQDYLAERTKRLNAEVAGEYKSKASKVSSDIQALEQEIQALEQDIRAEETATQTQGMMAPVADSMAEQVTPMILDEAEQEFGLNPSIDTGRMAQPIDKTLEPSAPSSDRSRLGEVPVPQGIDLAGLYDLNPSLDLGRSFATPQAPQNAQRNALPRSGVRTPQDAAEAQGIKGYRPLNAWYGGMK